MPESQIRMPTFLHHHAAADGTPAEVAALLAAGADPDALGDNGVTPLHLAAAHNAAPAVVEAPTGADPDARDGNGQTPLHRVVRLFNDPVSHARRAIEALLDGGADTKVRDDFGKMPFDYIKDRERWKETDLYRRLRS